MKSHKNTKGPFGYYPLKFLIRSLCCDWYGPPMVTVLCDLLLNYVESSVILYQFDDHGLVDITLCIMRVCVISLWEV